MTIKLKSKFDAKNGVLAVDNADGNLTKSMKVNGSVNPRKKGIYTICYSVTDQSGNKTVVERKIIVK